MINRTDYEIKILLAGGGINPEYRSRKEKQQSSKADFNRCHAIFGTKRTDQLIFLELENSDANIDRYSLKTSGDTGTIILVIKYPCIE